MEIDNRLVRSDVGQSNITQMGYFGNIWVRSHQFDKVGDSNGTGHKHNFDHVTLLAVGSVKVEVDDGEIGDICSDEHSPSSTPRFAQLTDDEIETLKQEV